MQIKLFNFSLTITLLLALLLTACNKQGELGDMIIESQQIGIFSDEWPLSIVTRSTDSVDTEGLSDHFLVGRIEDDVFGIFEASFYTQFSLDELDRTFSGVEVDSVFLELTYDTIAAYGVEDAEFDIYVYRMEQDPDTEVHNYSNTNLSVSSDPLGKLEDFVPEVIVTETVDTVSVNMEGVLQIPLNNSLGEELLSYDSLAYSSSQDFQEKFKGIYVKGGDENESFMGFQLSSSYVSTRLVVHYRNDSGDSLEFSLRVASGDYRMAKLGKDQSLGEIDNFVNNDETSKSLVFVSGLVGNYLELDLADAAENLEGRLLNSAEVCLTINQDEFSYDYDLYPSTEILASRFYDDAGDLQSIVDEGTSYYNSIIQIDSIENTQMFCINITGQLQRIARNGIDSRILFFPIYRANNPKRAIFYGVENQDYPAKLNVHYTEPQ